MAPIKFEKMQVGLLPSSSLFDPGSRCMPIYNETRITVRRLDTSVCCFNTNLALLFKFVWDGSESTVTQGHKISTGPSPWVYYSLSLSPSLAGCPSLEIRIEIRARSCPPVYPNFRVQKIGTGESKTMMFDLHEPDAAQEDPGVGRSMPTSFSFGGSPGSTFSISSTLPTAPTTELNLSLGSAPGFDFDDGSGFQKPAQKEDGVWPDLGFQVYFGVPQPQQPQLRVHTACHLEPAAL